MTVPADLGGDPPCWANLDDEQFGGPMAEAAKTPARKMAKALRRLLVGESAPAHCPVEVALVHPDPVDRPGRSVPPRDEGP